MTTHKEALKLALDALDGAETLLSQMGLTHLLVYGNVDKAITAIKEALAQPEKPQPDRITTLRQLTENHSVDCLCADCVELDDIEEALAQPEQEPVAWGVIASNTGKMCQVELDYDEVSDINSKWLVPLYTTPPQRTWVGLTDEDVVGLCREFMGQFDKKEFIKATEAKLKEKNT